MRRRSLAPAALGPYAGDHARGAGPGDLYQAARGPGPRPVSAYAATPGGRAGTGPGAAIPAAAAVSVEQHKPRAAAAAAQMRDMGRQREQRVGDYIVKQTLGKGTFSKVYLGEYRPTKQKVALKFIKPKSPQGGSTDKHNLRVEREIRLLSLLYHPNIVRLYDVIQTPKFTMI
ncbi:Protein kinase, partial [Coemansia spiralis]